MELQDILLIFLSVGKVAESVMLPAVWEEHALSLLEIQENVKEKSGFTVCHAKLTDAEVRELASKLTA